MRQLSKTRFMNGLQCHKRLWWEMHEPKAPELIPSIELQDRFDEGHAVGQKAQESFPGGVLVRAPHYRSAARVAETRAALATDAPAIFEASFLVDGIFVAVDALVRGDRAWTLVEVKSSTSVKAHYVPDAAVQTHVVRGAGIAVERVELMHLNGTCRYPDLDDLFMRADVTAAVEAFVPEVSDIAAAQWQMLQEPLPTVEPGDHCHEPYTCPFLKRCWSQIPEHHVLELHGFGAARADALVAKGYTSIQELPGDMPLRGPADRQRRAVQFGQLIVEPTLGAALEIVRYPLAVLDFETVQPAMPVWDGCAPWERVPAQFSCHVVDAQHEVSHHAWMAEGPEDPRPELARHLIEACKGCDVVVAYSASFEKRALRGLAAALPELADDLLEIEALVIDALPLIRDHVYHPDFHGSFSLKAVLPALVPSLSYANLEVASGMVASIALKRRMLGPTQQAGTEEPYSREALLTYCELDTWGVVCLLDRLVELSSQSPDVTG